MVQKKKKHIKDKVLIHNKARLHRLRKNSPALTRTRSPEAVVDDIPRGYNIDTIVIMPVNVNTNFIYWEITEKLLNGRRKKIDTGSAKLMIKVFETDQEKEIYSFEASDRIGNHYISHHAAFSSIYAEIGLLKNKRFTGLLRSNPLTVPSAEKKSKENNLWMTRIDNSFKVARYPEHDIVGYIRDSSLARYYSSIMASCEDPFSSIAFFQMLR